MGLVFFFLLCPLQSLRGDQYDSDHGEGIEAHAQRIYPGQAHHPEERPWGVVGAPGPIPPQVCCTSSRKHEGNDGTELGHPCDTLTARVPSSPCPRCERQEARGDRHSAGHHSWLCPSLRCMVAATDLREQRKFSPQRNFHPQKRASRKVPTEHDPALEVKECLHALLASACSSGWTFPEQAVG